MLKYFNGFPIYNASINDVSQGIMFISLVDEPAVEKDWVMFKKEEAEVKFALESEEKRLISGVIMTPDYPLLQESEDGYFYVSYSKEVIRQMAEKLLVDGTYKNIDIMHNSQVVDGVNLVELYIKDSEKGLVPSFLSDIPDGTLVGTFHIVNDALWDEIKNGDFLKGFSLAGRFAMTRETVNNNKHNIEKKMMNLFKKMLVKFASVETKQGTLYYADELAVGVDVFVDNENVEVAPDGEYETEDKVIVVADGKVTEIKDKEVETPEAEPEVETPVENEEVPEVEPEEEPAEEPEENPYEQRIIALEEKVGNLESEIAALKEALAKIVEQPQAEPVAEEFEKIQHKEININGLPKDAQKALKLFKR